MAPNQLLFNRSNLLASQPSLLLKISHCRLAALGQSTALHLPLLWISFGAQAALMQHVKGRQGAWECRGDFNQEAIFEKF
jgi:hypothetical protein